MRGWKNAHKKANRKRTGPALARRDARLLKLINRYAASKDCPSQARERIYALKDLLMNKFGKVLGLSLQTWTTEWYDYWDKMVWPDACIHQHVLQRVRIGGMILHRPTGHFSFVNEHTDYYKQSEGFKSVAAQCTEHLSGRKREQIKDAPDKHSAARAYEQLARRHRRLWLQTDTMLFRPQPRVRKGYTADDDWLDEIRRRSRWVSVKEFFCQWCKQTKPGSERNLIVTYEICDTCRPKLRVAVT